ncbi:hypothetical protein GPECTOR_6g744 [Gonium pectorale]|uniref:Uncharacterized protein n=1 Tax=Gonium pectorale TaxID=33097 RepID=A0A150GVB8_GONPE|nr:hypothetical protein GPECTOR_6g744 [Gonium pectorale]|eukprot:KXZ53826.1 hypothetical protein GPECTOR_6g744 [Gonium pectorale]
MQAPDAALVLQDGVYGVSTWDLVAYINGGAYIETVGTMYLFMKSDGALTLTVRLNCPWLAVIDESQASAALSLSLALPNGSSWTETQTSTESGSHFLSCASLSVQLEQSFDWDAGVAAEHLAFNATATFLVSNFVAYEAGVSEESGSVQYACNVDGVATPSEATVADTTLPGAALPYSTIADAAFASSAFASSAFASSAFACAAIACAAIACAAIACAAIASAAVASAAVTAAS